MNISYLDFWNGFNPNKNWLSVLISDFLNNENIEFNAPPEEADIIIFSSFGQENLKYNNPKTKKIFFTGENRRPPIDRCDYALTFDLDNYNNKNFRLPLWYLHIDWWKEQSFEPAKIKLKDLYRQWDPEEILNRNYFGSIIIGNYVENRILAAQAIASKYEVHAFGHVFNNHYLGDKFELLKNYKFNIAFENTIYPGYVTEKLLEAKVAGCIPIYWGTDASCDFNENCIIRYKNNPTELFKEVDFLYTNKNELIKKINEPLFIDNKYPTLDLPMSYLKIIFK
jgi:hypothetical protein